MNEETDINEQIRHFIEVNSKESVNAEGAFCTNFVLVGELMDTRGQFYTWAVIDQNAAPWRTEGLLNYTIQNELYATAEETEDEEY